MSRPPVDNRFTLDEASIELARRECVQRGHDWTVLAEQFSVDPAAVICERCGKSWCVFPPISKKVARCADCGSLTSGSVQLLPKACGGCDSTNLVEGGQDDREAAA